MAKRSNQLHSGASQRQLRVAETIRRSLSELLLRGDIHDEDLAKISLTIGEVRISPDLKIATVYVSRLGGGETEMMIKALARNKTQIRQALNKKLTLKFSPDLRFQPDLSFDQFDETNRLLSQAHVRQDLENASWDEDETG